LSVVAVIAPSDKTIVIELPTELELKELLAIRPVGPWICECGAANQRRRVRDDLQSLARDWRHVLVDDPDRARPIGIVATRRSRHVHADVRTEAVGIARGRNDRGIVLD